MNINGKEVKLIRPMTKQEKDELFTPDPIATFTGDLFCIELVDNSIIYPTFDCCECMIDCKCLFNIINKMPNDHCSVHKTNN